MKKIKKMIGILLALVMVFSLSSAAFAGGIRPSASSDDTKGTITINDAGKGETYTVYQIFELTYSTDGNNYSYKVVDDWSSFIEEYRYENAAGETVSLFSLDNSGYLLSDSKIFDESNNSDVMKAFSQAALAFALINKIEPAGKAVAEGSSVTFDNLDLGYYLVDTTLGSLCFLDSTSPSVEITEKNPTPYSEKEVYDEETDEGYTDEDTAEVGDTLKFEVFLHDVAHSSKLCMHDVMTEGLTFSAESVEVYVGYPDSSVDDLFSDDKTNWALLTAGEEYTKNDNCGDGCAFELSFDDEWLNGLGDGAVIRVCYEAVVNENAIDESDLWSVQTNDVHLTYGESSSSTNANTKTDTVGFYILKYSGDVANVISGAKFSLYRDAEHEDIVSFVPITEEGSVVGYEEVDPNNYTGSGKIVTEIEAGYIYVKGLHEGTYYLYETEAPNGYNALKNDVVITVTLTASMNNGYTETVTVNGDTITGTIVEIENNSGSVLPGTGGMGTTIFYVIGIVILAGAVVLIVSRRRLNRAE